MTPPLRARSGNTCPGRTRSRGRVSAAIATWTVWARSAAEMPVLVPSRASIDAQNAVSRTDRCSLRSSGICSWLRRSGIIARQINPRPCFAMKLIASGVTVDAAIVKSSSFSRSSSSTTMTIWPSRMATIYSSMVAKGPVLRAPLAMRIFGFFEGISISHGPTGPRQLASCLRQFHRTGDVLADHVGLQVHPLVRADRRQVRVLPGERDNHHIELVVAQVSHRQADPVDRDRPFAHDERRQCRRKLDRHPVGIAVSANRSQLPDTIHVALDEVPAEAAVGPHGALEIERLPGLERAQRRDARRFGPDLRVQVCGAETCPRQAHPVNGHAVSEPQL